ncbi:MAG TPA: glycosyltransferase family 39 protein [Planctomycetota bacterium]|nr:glycosyltransferase family 39 protein [Planctomycetota bacterium]
MPSREHSLRWLAAAIALYLITAGWNIGGKPVSNAEEARYAVAARTMLRDGDWLVPKFNGELRLKKPIFFYWIIAAAGSIGHAAGPTLLTAMRLGSLAMGMLALIATFLIARKFAGGSLSTGLVAAIVLITCNEFHKVSRELIPEMTLTACLTWAWYFALIALDRSAGNRRVIFQLLGLYVSLGLACMTKGPLPVGGFMVLPFVAYLVWTGRFKALARAGLWWGVPLTTALGFWWFFVIRMRGHGGDVAEFFKHENWDRVFGQNDHIHPFPWIYYFTIWPEGLLPWLIAIPFMAEWARSRHKQGEAWISSDGAKYVCCALGIAFLIIGLSASKRTTYLLTLYPPFAVWAALIWKQAIDAKPASKKLLGGVLALAVLLALGFEIVIASQKDQLAGQVAFFAEIKQKLNGRTLVTFNESPNEAIWYLDVDRPIGKVTPATLDEKFFKAPRTVLLIQRTKLVKIAELESALIIELERKRGRDVYCLAVPNSAHPPDPRIFERNSKEADTGDD